MVKEQGSLLGLSEYGSDDDMVKNNIKSKLTKQTDRYNNNNTIKHFYTLLILLNNPANTVSDRQTLYYQCNQPFSQNFHSLFFAIL